MGTTIVSFHITFEMEGYKITYVWDKCMKMLTLLVVKDEEVTASTYEFHPNSVSIPIHIYFWGLPLPMIV